MYNDGVIRYVKSCTNNSAAMAKYREFEKQSKGHATIMKELGDLGYGEGVINYVERHTTGAAKSIGQSIGGQKTKNTEGGVNVHSHGKKWVSFVMLTITFLLICHISHPSFLPFVI